MATKPMGNKGTKKTGGSAPAITKKAGAGGAGTPTLEATIKAAINGITPALDQPTKNSLMGYSRLTPEQRIGWRAGEKAFTTVAKRFETAAAKAKAAGA